MPTDPSELNKKPPLEKLERVNNNYNKLVWITHRFQFISKPFGVVGKHTSKITRRADDKSAQLIKITNRGAITHPQLLTRRAAVKLAQLIKLTSRAAAKLAQLINAKDIT